ncbi:MAG: hypothetical protein WBS24_12300 [Terriglobales bacterium]
MIEFAGKFWPPVKTFGLSVRCAFIVGFIVQLAIPFALPHLGLEKAELIMNPGLLIIVRATGGWLAGITPMGYLFIFAVNTFAYGTLPLAAFRMCACLQRQHSSR